MPPPMMTTRAEDGSSGTGALTQVWACSRPEGSGRRQGPLVGDVGPLATPRLQAGANAATSADMTDPDLLDLALDAARAAGATASDALLVDRRSLDVGWRMGDLEELEQKK